MSLQREVKKLPQAICVGQRAICVDCGWKAIFNSGNFDDQGSRGTFCANQTECMVRLIPQGSRRKSQESTGNQEVVKVTKDAMLRLVPFLTSVNKPTICPISSKSFLPGTVPIKIGLPS